MLSPLPDSKRIPADGQSKRQLFLHIGTPKTGTTSLQYYLYENRDLLRERGYLYPTGLNLTMAKGHHPLYFAIASTWWHPDFYHDINSERLPEGSYRPEYDIDDCMRELRYAAANSENLILSSEGLFFLDDCGVRTLSDLLSAFDVSVVVYLRRQDQFVEAMYRHFVFDSGARFRMPVDRYISNEGLEHCKYLEKVDTWAEHFGAENVTVIPYQSSSMKDGDMVFDFLDRIGVDSSGMPSPRRVNQSQPNDILSALSIANLSDWECREDAADYGRFLRESFDSNHEVSSLLSRSQAIEFLDRFSEDNQKLACKYLGNAVGQLFDESYPEPSDQPPPDQQHVERDKAVSLLHRSVELLLQAPSTDSGEIVLATTALFRAARNSLRSETERRLARDRQFHDARPAQQRAEQSEGPLCDQLQMVQDETELLLSGRESNRDELQRARAETEAALAEAERTRMETDAAVAEAEQARMETETAVAEAEQARGELEVALAVAEREQRKAEVALAEAERTRLETEAAVAEVELLRKEVESSRQEATSLSEQLAASQAENKRAESQIQNILWIAEKHAQRADQAHAELQTCRRSFLFRILFVPVQRAVSTMSSVLRSVVPGSGVKPSDRTQRAAVAGPKGGMRHALRHPRKAVVQLFRGPWRAAKYFFRQPRKSMALLFLGPWRATKYAVRQPRKAILRTFGAYEADGPLGNNRRAA